MKYTNFYELMGAIDMAIDSTAIHCLCLTWWPYGDRGNIVPSRTMSRPQGRGGSGTKKNPSRTTEANLVQTENPSRTKGADLEPFRTISRTTGENLVPKGEETVRVLYKRLLLQQDSSFFPEIYNWINLKLESGTYRTS